MFTAAQARELVEKRYCEDTELAIKVLEIGVRQEAEAGRQSYYYAVDDRIQLDLIANHFEKLGYSVQSEYEYGVYYVKVSWD